MNLDPSLAPAGVLTLVGLILIAIGIAVLIGALSALRRRRLAAMSLRGLIGVAALLAGVLAAGLSGYASLTHEALAARLSVRPTGDQRFEATITFPGGQKAQYELAGDELYVDARILKWHPLANLAGLHTLWSLERIAGRYRDIGDERDAPRTIYPLSREPIIDLFELRRRFAWLAPFYDAEYGSASFVPIREPAQLEVRVSTSGLLIRPGSPSS